MLEQDLHGNVLYVPSRKTRSWVESISRSCFTWCSRLILSVSIATSSEECRHILSDTSVLSSYECNLDVWVCSRALSSRYPVWCRVGCVYRHILAGAETGWVLCTSIDVCVCFTEGTSWTKTFPPSTGTQSTRRPCDYILSLTRNIKWDWRDGGVGEPERWRQTRSRKARRQERKTVRKRIRRKVEKERKNDYRKKGRKKDS